MSTDTPSNRSSSAAGVLTALSDAGTTLATRLGPSVVSIGTDGRGTGVVIATDRVLTTAHHLRDRTTAITFNDGRQVQGTVIGLDVDGDLAVLSVPTAAAVPVEWAARSPSVGSVVFAVARGGGQLRLSFGLISGVDRRYHSGTGHVVSGALEHSAPLAKGSSGGPLVDTDGRLVAITTRREHSGFSLARPGDERLQARVGELIAGRSTPRRRLGVTLASEAMAAHLRSSVGLSPRAGLLVRSVEENSPGARAGLTGGDLLVAADGVALLTSEELHHAISAADDHLTLRAVRGSEERDVVVSFVAEPSESSPLGAPDLTA